MRMEQLADLALLVMCALSMLGAVYIAKCL
jgi:hypothetical protein